MEEAEKEANGIIEMFLNVKSNKINDYSKIEYPTAKQCAILHVEGILELCDKRFSNPNPYFWQQVKQAIEKA